MQDHDVEVILSSARRPKPRSKTYGTEHHPDGIIHVGQLYSTITDSMYAAANDALALLNIPARYVTASGMSPYSCR